MEEIRKINKKIANKQIGRFVGGIASVVLAMVLFGKYTYQKGITAGQKAIYESFPEEYNAILSKIVKACENHK